MHAAVYQISVSIPIRVDSSSPSKGVCVGSVSKCMYHCEVHYIAKSIAPPSNEQVWLL